MDFTVAVSRGGLCAGGGQVPLGLSGAFGAGDIINGTDRRRAIRTAVGGHGGRVAQGRPLGVVRDSMWSSIESSATSNGLT